MQTKPHVVSDPTVQRLTTITTINYYNNENNFNDCADGSNQEPVGYAVSGPTRGGSPQDSLIAPQAFLVGKSEMESAPWTYIKADLFNNVTEAELLENKHNFRIKFSFKLPNKPDWQYLSAALNSPKRSFKRGFNPQVESQLIHMKLAEQVYESFIDADLENVFVSKCYMSGTGQKGDTIYGASVVIGQMSNIGQYCAVLIMDDKMYDMELSGKLLTNAQRKTGLVASYSQNLKATKQQLTTKDFFGK